MAKKFLMQRRVTIDGVLPDGIDDNAIGGLLEGSTMAYGCLIKPTKTIYPRGKLVNSLGF